MKIYVGQLAPEVTDGDLQELFTAHGEVESAEVVKDRFSGSSRGFGFVVMPTKQEAIAAITALQGQELKGQILNVNEARPPSDRRGGQRGRSRDDRRPRGGQRF